MHKIYKLGLSDIIYRLRGSPKENKLNLTLANRVVLKHFFNFFNVGEGDVNCPIQEQISHAKYFRKIFTFVNRSDPYVLCRGPSGLNSPISHTIHTRNFILLPKYQQYVVSYPTLTYFMVLANLNFKLYIKNTFSTKIAI